MGAEQFDLAAGLQAKEEGMALAAENRKRLLTVARAIARGIGLVRREVTMDMVSREMLKRNLPIDLGPAAGSVFKTDQWEWTGRYTKSHRITNHGRMIRIWRYIG